MLFIVFYQNDTKPPHFSNPPFQPPVKEATFQRPINFQLIKRFYHTLFSHLIAFSWQIDVTKSSLLTKYWIIYMKYNISEQWTLENEPLLIILGLILFISTFNHLFVTKQMDHDGGPFVLENTFTNAPRSILLSQAGFGCILCKLTKKCFSVGARFSTPHSWRPLFTNQFISNEFKSSSLHYVLI